MSLTTDVEELLEALGPFYEYVKEEDSGVEMESGAMSALLGKFSGPLTKIKYQEVIGQHFLSKYLFFFGPIGSTSFPSIFQSALLQFSIYLYAPGTFYRYLYTPGTYLYGTEVCIHDILNLESSALTISYLDQQPMS